MRELRINERFESACPPLSLEEFTRLEELIIKDGVIFNPILIWDDVIIDGHNRFHIAIRHNLTFTTNDIHFESDEEAIIWIKENAISQRNLTDFQKYELTKDIAGLREALIEKGRENKAHGQTAPGKTLLLQITEALEPDETPPPPVTFIDHEAIKVIAEKHDTRKELAKKAGMSTGQFAKAEQVDKMVDEETKELLRKGQTTIGREYQKIKELKPKDDIDTLESLAKSLDRVVSTYCDKPICFDFIPEIKDIIKRVRDKKAIS